MHPQYAQHEKPAPDRYLPQVIVIAACLLIAGCQTAVPPGYRQQARAFEQVPRNAAGDEALVGGVNPWHYWGADFDVETTRLTPQVWRDTPDILDGWDWSLPPSVKPADNARIRFGFHGWKKGIDAFNPPPGVKVVDELWVRWRTIEEKEGEYDFSRVEAEIAERLAAGCDGVIIRMLGAVWTSGSPADWQKWEQNATWRFARWSAPRWLVETYGVDKLPMGEGSEEVVHVDIFHEVYHRKYLAFIDAFKRSGILHIPEVQGLIVCGMCKANGEEGHGTYELSKVPREIAEQRYRERLRAWQQAFGPGNEHKVIAMLPDGKEMVGARDGFVEMYLYNTNDPEMRGQYVDRKGYLSVNEEAFYIKHGDTLLFGDENEEYHPDRWADRPGRPGRFGPVESFNYRYFTSMLRLLQMRRNYLYAGEEAVNPQLMWYVLHELGRTAEDAPDAWCFLRESRLSHDRGPLKNFERWLYQRDRDGFETEPAIKIPHAIKKWWLTDPEHRYDFVARRGKRIGLALDDQFVSGPARVAVKVSYYDGYAGSWALHYTHNGESRRTPPVESTGKDTFRTATFFIDADFDAAGTDFDLEVHSPTQVPISIVRVIKL